MGHIVANEPTGGVRTPSAKERHHLARFDNNESMTESFAERFVTVRSKFGPLAWGFDPSATILESWGLGDTPDGLDRFADLALEAASGIVGIIKPQAAFFERHGWRGFRTLQRLAVDGRSARLLVIIDAKRGDVGTTNDAYAQAFLGADAPLAADALTVHPYLGVAAMTSLVRRAQEAGSCLLIVTRSSNPEGRQIQSATVGYASVEQAILDEIGRLNAELAAGRIGPVGAVIGPTHIEPGLDLRSPQAIYLAPGVGAQGATASDVARVFEACPDRVIPSASRLLLEPGPELSRLRDTASALALEINLTLNNNVTALSSSTKAPTRPPSALTLGSSLTTFP